MLKLITPPTTELLTTAQAKAWLRVTSSSEDSLIDSLVLAARQEAENYTQRCFITQTWDLWLDGIPGQVSDQWWDGVREGALSELYGGSKKISLRRGPVQSISYVKSYDLSDAEETFDTANYYADTVSTPGRVCLNYNAIWPVNLREHNALVVRFVAGYGAAASSVPDPIIRAVAILTAHFYEHRGDAVVGDEMRSQTAVIPTTVRRLLEPYIIRGFV